MIRICLAAGALAIAAPLSAQTPAPAKPATPALDPGALAEAGRTVDYVFPSGTYARMFKDMMGPLMDSVMAQTFNMTPADMGMGENVPEAERGKSIGEMAAERDPHFQERMRLTNKVMGEQMGAMFAVFEPPMRAGLARAYAKRFSAPQLVEMNRFFATPTGKAYAADSMLIYADPEVITSMMSVMPELMKQMPEMMKKVEAATAHLPPPPKPEGESVDDETTEPDDDT